MKPRLNIVAACTERKRSTGGPPVRLRDVPLGPDRAGRWLAALRGHQPQLPAAELYVGDHWSIARSLPAVAEAAGFDATLWAASAGYGLVRADQPLVNYSATFSLGHPDSVARASDGPDATQAWWSDLNRASGHVIADASAPASWLVIGSPAYVHAMEQQLLGLLPLAKNLLLVTGQPGPTDGRLRQSWVVSSSTHQPLLGGALPALHARVARHLIRSVKEPADLSSDWANAFLHREGQASPGFSRPDRQRSSDEDVRLFILSALAGGRRESHTKLLRAFRAAGRACEQSRFRALFMSVAGS
jgi:hypothetical protein